MSDIIDNKTTEEAAENSAPIADTATASEIPEANGSDADIQTAATENAEDEDNFCPVIIDDDYDAEERDYRLSSTGRIAGLSAEDLAERPKYKRPKLGFKAGIEDFLYRYKTVLIIGVIAAVFLTIMIIESIPTKYDYTFQIYSDGLYFDDVGLGDIAEQLNAYGEDLDGNGKVVVSVQSYNTSATDVNIGLVAVLYMTEEFKDEHEGYLVLTDKLHYDQIIDGFGEGAIEAYDGCPKWMPIGDTGLLTSVIDEYRYKDVELGLSLVALSEEDAQDEELVARHDAAVRMLDKILADYPSLRGE